VNVSVIIPARERSDLLQRAVYSALAQTGPVCEVLVVDDGSEQPLQAEIARISDSRVRCVRYESGVNAAYARNRGLELAKGDLVAFLDSDDWWLPRHVEEMVSEIATHDWIGAMTGYVAVYSESVSEVITRGADVISGARGFGEFLFERGGPCRMSTMVVHREAAAMFGFDEALRKHQDWDFALRLAEIGKLGFVQARQTYVDHSAYGRMSKGTPVEASFRFLHKHGGEISAASRRGFLFAAAQSAALRGDRRGAWELLASLEGVSMRERLRSLAIGAVAIHPSFVVLVRRAYVAVQAFRSRGHVLAQGEE